MEINVATAVFQVSIERIDPALPAARGAFGESSAALEK